MPEDSPKKTHVLVIKIPLICRDDLHAREVSNYLITTCGFNQFKVIGDIKLQKMGDNKPPKGIEL